MKYVKLSGININTCFADWYSVGKYLSERFFFREGKKQNKNLH